MTKKDFAEKYDSAIRAVAVANDADMSVGRDMLIYELKCHAGAIERVDTYAGIPTDLDLCAAYADYKSITD